MGLSTKNLCLKLKKSSLSTKEGHKGLNVLYDTGSKIKMIHPQLAKEMGFKTEDREMNQIFFDLINKCVQIF